MPKSLDINQLLSRIRAEAEALDLPGYPQPTPIEDFAQHEELASRVSGSERATHIQSLLLAPRERFLHEAYRSLFGRDADPAGLDHYQGMLAEGHSRTEVLYALTRSPEGRALGVKIHGLGWRALLCRWSLKLRKYSPHRILSALLAGRGGKMGALARLIPPRILRLLLTPFHINHLPGTWLRAWEHRLIAPFAIVGRWILEQQQHTEHISRTLKKHEEEQDNLRARIEGSQNELLNQLRASQEQARQTDEELLSQLRAHQEHVSQTESALRQSIATQASRQNELEKTLDWLRYSVSRQWHQALGSTPPLMAAPAKEPLTAEQEALDAFYIAFEDTCRGSEADIREGLRVYLDRVRRSAAAQGLPIVDIGCGRGEWLRILKDEGFTARGVDQSAAMVERARAYGLDVEQGDAVAALSRLPEASLGGVTGFHIIEHLPFPVLFRLFAEVSRVLAPGGIAIFETPNPENVLVGSHTFYHDPTHRNPITPTFITFLAQYHGLAEIEIVRLHPYPESAKVPGHDPLTERVNGHLCGPQDFALVAYRPRPA
ncbi:MAG: methyltransferase domain-containing protein [Pseudomonadota bacterium]